MAERGGRGVFGMESDGLFGLRRSGREVRQFLSKGYQTIGGCSVDESSMLLSLSTNYECPSMLARNERSSIMSMSIRTITIYVCHRPDEMSTRQ